MVEEIISSFVLAVSDTIYIQQELTNETRVCPQMYTMTKNGLSSLVGTVTSWVGEESPLATRGESFLINQASQSVLDRLLWHGEICYLNKSELSSAPTSETRLRTGDITHVFGEENNATTYS